MTTVDIRKGIRALLLGDASISSMVGGERIFYTKLPQGQDETSIVYSRITGTSYYHNQGPSGLMRPRFQMDVYSVVPGDSFALANLVKERMEGFQGSVAFGSESPQETVRVKGIFLDNEDDGWDPDSEMYRVRQDYFVFFAERVA